MIAAELSGIEHGLSDHLEEFALNDMYAIRGCRLATSQWDSRAAS
jgi:hypothetical protein